MKFELLVKNSFIAMMSITGGEGGGWEKTWFNLVYCSGITAKGIHQKNYD